MTVTSFGLLGLGRCSFTVLLPFSKYPPCFGAAPWLPPVPVIPCWWCWWPGTKFSFRSRFSTFLLTKADIALSGGLVLGVQRDLFDIWENRSGRDFVIVSQMSTASFNKKLRAVWDWYCSVSTKVVVQQIYSIAAVLFWQRDARRKKDKFSRDFIYFYPSVRKWNKSNFPVSYTSTLVLLQLEGCFLSKVLYRRADRVDNFANHVSAHTRREGSGALSLPRANSWKERSWSSDRLFSGMDCYSRGKNGDD